MVAVDASTINHQQSSISNLVEPLSERELEVLRLIAAGLSNREIGDDLELSEGTVKIHVTAIFKALGVASRTQALVAVARYGIDLGKVF